MWPFSNFSSFSDVKHGPNLHFCIILYNTIVNISTKSVPQVSHSNTLIAQIAEHSCYRLKSWQSTSRPRITVITPFSTKKLRPNYHLFSGRTNKIQTVSFFLKHPDLNNRMEVFITSQNSSLEIVYFKQSILLCMYLQGGIELEFIYFLFVQSFLPSRSANKSTTILGRILITIYGLMKAVITIASRSRYVVMHEK